MSGPTDISTGKKSSETALGSHEAPTVSKRFDWPLANGAEDLLRAHSEAFLERNTFARVLADRMRDETGTDFFEWIDHLILLPTE